MRPAFGVCISNEDLSELRLRTIRMKELQEVSRVSLMDGREEQASFAGDILVLFLLVPFRIGRRDVIYRRKIFLIRSRNVYVGKVPCFVWRSLFDLTFFSTRKSDNIFFLDKFSEI